MAIHVLSKYTQLEYVNFENQIIKLRVQRAGSEKYFVEQVFGCLLTWRHNLFLGLGSLGRIFLGIKCVFVGILIIHDWGKRSRTAFPERL